MKEPPNTTPNNIKRQNIKKRGRGRVRTFSNLSFHDRHRTVEIPPSQIQSKIICIYKRTSEGITFAGPEDGTVADLFGMDTSEPVVGRGDERGRVDLNSGL